MYKGPKFSLKAQCKPGVTNVAATWMLEEIAEMVEALNAKDLNGVIDAHLDLLGIVLLSTGILLGRTTSESIHQWIEHQKSRNRDVSDKIFWMPMIRELADLFATTDDENFISGFDTLIRKFPDAANRFPTTFQIHQRIDKTK